MYTDNKILCLELKLIKGHFIDIIYLKDVCFHKKNKTGT